MANYYGEDAFPIITTKRIRIVDSHQQKVKVEYALRLPQGIDSGTLLRDFSSIGDIRIFFVILDDTSYSLITNLMNVRTRQAAIDMINREQQKLLAEDLNQLPSFAINRIADSKAMASMAFEEVLQNQRTMRVSASDLGGEYYHDVYGEIEIPYDPPTSYSEMSTNRLHLVSFFHVLVEEDKYTDALGGGLVYDLLLERAENGRLTIPNFINAFFVDDPSAGMIPYYGPAHYHGPNNSADGYVGWMAGHMEGEMGPRLTVHQVRNYKISSDVSFGAHRSIVGTPAANRLAAHAGSSRAPAGQEVEGFLNSFFDQNTLLDKQEKIRRMAIASLYSDRINNLNVVQHGTANTAHINVIVDETNTAVPSLANSNHAFVLGINILDIIKSESSFGHIVNFHDERGNTSFVSEAVRYSKIAGIKITRRRVDSIPYSSNKLATPEYPRYNSEDTDMFLISSADETRSLNQRVFGRSRNSGPSLGLAAAETPRGSIEEVEVLSFRNFLDSSSRPRTHHRHFLIKDFDLFHNVESGKYTYLLELILHDGTRDVISIMFNRLKDSLKDFQEYIKEASTAAVRNPAGDDYLHGNYDYLIGDHTPAFKNSTNFENTIKKAVDSYCEIVRFIGSTPVHYSVKERLYNFLSPIGVSLETLHQFEDLLSSLASTLKDVLYTGVEKSFDGFISHGQEISVPDSPAHIQRQITVSSKTNVFIDAFSKTSVLADYSQTRGVFQSIVSSQDLYLRLNSNPETFNDITPSRYILCDPVAFKEKQVNVVQKTGRRPEINSGRMKDIEHRTEGHIQIISTFEDYSTSSPLRREFIDTKMNVLRKLDAENTAMAEKEESFFPQMLQTFSGLALGTSTGVSFTSPLSMARSLNLFDNSPNMSEEVQEAICEAAYKGTDKDFFVNSISSTYKDLVQTRKQLGNLYDQMNKIFGLFDSIVSQGATNSNFKARFLGTGPGKVSRNINLPGSTYDRDASTAFMVGPGVEKSTANLAIVLKQGRKMSTQTRKKFVILKYEPEREKDNIIPVNNVMMVEV